MKIKTRLLSGIIAASILAISSAPVLAKSFPDTGEHWAKDAINLWSNHGVINGDDLGNFRPNDPITRAEAATVLDNLISYVKTSDKSFSDVAPTDWFAAAISKLNYANVITGYEDGTARPKSNITRQEAAVVIARAIGLVTDSADLTVLDQYSDKDSIQTWAKPSIAVMSKLGYIQGNDGAFRPTAPITRAEFITIINNIVAIYATGVQSTYTGDYGNKIAIIKMPTIFKGTKLGGAVISPMVSGRITFNNAAEINGCLYDLSAKATVYVSDAYVENTSSPYKGNQSGNNINYGGNYSNSYYGGNYNNNSYGGGGSSGGSSSSPSIINIYLYANGGIFDDKKSSYSESCKNGTTFSSLSLPTPTREGYIFDGWYTTETGANTLTAALKINTSIHQFYDHTSLYAGWKKDLAILGKVTAASGKIDGKDASDLMNITLSNSSDTDYVAAGTVYYTTNYGNYITKDGNFIALTYTLPTTISDDDVANATLTITFDGNTYIKNQFAANNKTNTTVLLLNADNIKNKINYHLEVSGSEETYTDLTVDISKLTLTGMKSVKTKDEFVSALSDATTAVISVDEAIELNSATYQPSGNTAKTVIINKPLSLAAGADVTIKNISFATGDTTIASLITAADDSNLTFDSNKIKGNFTSVIDAKSGNYTLRNNQFENTGTKTDCSAITTTDGVYEITGNTFKGYHSAVKYNSAMTLSKNIFKENTYDVSFGAGYVSQLLSENKLPNVANNFFDDAPAVLGTEQYIAAPVYTDETCASLSEASTDALLMAKTNTNTVFYKLSETAFIPFTTDINITVIPMDERITDVLINDTAVTATLVNAAGTIKIKVGNGAEKTITVGHSSIDITVKAATAADLTGATEITPVGTVFTYDATSMSTGDKLYINVVAQDASQILESLSITDGETFTLTNGIAEITLGDTDMTLNVNSIANSDGTPVDYTIVIDR